MLCRLIYFILALTACVSLADDKTIEEVQDHQLPVGIWVGLSNDINKEITALRISKQGSHGFIHASISSALSIGVNYKFTDKDIKCDKYFCHITMAGEQNNSRSLSTFLDPIWDELHVTELDPTGYSDAPKVLSYKLHRVEDLAVLDTYVNNVRKRQPLTGQSGFAGDWIGYTKNENLSVTNNYLVNLYIREDGHAELESYLLRSITPIKHSEFNTGHLQHDDNFIDIEVEALAGLCLGAAKLTLSKVTNNSMSGYYRCLHHRHKNMLNEGFIEFDRK
ncbi:hypothetical protein [Pseudoalteromonas galatheae]|uniref:hypothetical protein n=1 Tax=Pseudoalteromonas galatheae TaxID=579562 RepID=UPI0030D5C656